MAVIENFIVSNQKADKMKIYSTGDSMLPTLPKRGYVDVHFFGRTEHKNLKIGDIVVYHSKGFSRDGKPSFWQKGKCIHRIVELNKVCAMIKGDNRNYAEHVEIKDIIGIMI